MLSCRNENRPSGPCPPRSCEERGQARGERVEEERIEKVGDGGRMEGGREAGASLCHLKIKFKE